MGMSASLRARMRRTEPRAQHAERLLWRLNRGNVDIYPPNRGVGWSGRHYKRLTNAPSSIE